MEHMGQFTGDFLNSMEINRVIDSFLDNLKLNAALSVLYGLVWIWGIIGKKNYCILLQCFRLILNGQGSPK